jgi:hypothetical protein
VVDVPLGSDIRIDPPGDEGLCSVPLGTTNVSPRYGTDHALGAVGVAHGHVEPAVEHQEELVGGRGPCCLVWSCGRGKEV